MYINRDSQLTFIISVKPDYFNFNILMLRLYSCSM